MHGRMDGCVGEWIDAWMNGWVNEWMHGRKDGWMEVWVNGWMCGRMNGWMHGCMDDVLSQAIHVKHQTLPHSLNEGDVSCSYIPLYEDYFMQRNTTKQPTSKLINQTINQPTNKAIEQSIKQTNKLATNLPNC